MDGYISNTKLSGLTGVAAEDKGKIERIRKDLMARFFNADNLNLLISNGCSSYAGSKTINVENNDSNYTNTILNFRLADSKHSEISNRINSLAVERPEVLLDKLFEIKMIFESTLPDEVAATEIRGLIEQYKESFIKEYVLNIDYNKNEFHKKFLKRLLSRDDKLSKPNIFTLNYDLLFELSAEQLGIIVNNGFIGFHERSFYPSTFQVDYHISSKEVAKRLNRSMNLFKLHGSLSWYEDPNKPPFGIGEKQIIPKSGLIDYQEIESGTIIYPIQTKKKHSLDLPYSELMRQLVDALNKPNAVMIVMGYSFMDEHINDILLNAIANPDFNLVIFSYDTPDDSKANFLKELAKQAEYDPRITIFFGSTLGSFETIVDKLLPLPESDNQADVFFRTFNAIRENMNNEN